MKKILIMFGLLVILFTGCSSIENFFEEPGTLFNGPKTGAITQEFQNTKNLGHSNESTQF